MVSLRVMASAAGGQGGVDAFPGVFPDGQLDADGYGGDPAHRTGVRGDALGGVVQSVGFVEAGDAEFQGGAARVGHPCGEGREFFG